ncbi:AraC-type DNA-binding protein [Streptomyces qinglanensis]|uniref:AraC-type DNA-binding protein n=1 Tax=Streptomyces qinglanensis TaxID=943816 RepID=A0A1H9VZJ7_9ACTN|nr:helix-turn-helix domain-containing protein [Streptomyces qinglanensis]SES26941.1 AraC-type DNA-binding protein [Streptomyces qinglanensis]
MVATDSSRRAHRTMPLHRLDVPAPRRLPFAIGTFDSIGPLSRAAYPHRHTFHEIAYVTGGSGAHVIDLRRWTLRPPHLCFITPGQSHHWQQHEQVQGCVVLFDEAFLLAHPGDRTLLRRLGAHPSLPLSPPAAARVAELLAGMRTEYGQAQPGMRTVLQAYLHILLVQADRLPAQEHPGGAPDGEAACSRPAAVAGQFVRLLERPEAAAARTVTACAAELGVSVGYLNTAVRTGTGRTPGELIRHAHVLEAKRLLAGTAMTVRQVAHEVGFADPAYFCRFFRRETGASPGEFRRENHGTPGSDENTTLR